MSYWRLLCLLPLAYIIWWFYALLTWIIPAANNPIGGIAGTTWLQVVSVILFFSLGLLLLIVAFIAFVGVLIAD